MRQTLCDIFHRAADGVAAVQRALGPTQNFDAFYLINVEDRSLRTVQIHIVEIDADTGFKTRHWILLPDTANKSRQCRVTAARCFKRGVRRDVANVGQVKCATQFKRFARKCADGDGHIEQIFFAAAGSDDDFITTFRARSFVLRHNRRGHCHAGNGNAGQ